MSLFSVTNLIKIFTAGIVTMLFTSASHAQTTSPQGPVNPFDAYSWQLQPRGVTIDIDSTVPANCIMSAVLGSQTWNGISDFNVNGFSFTSNPDNHPDIKYKYGTTMPNSGGETIPSQPLAWILIDGFAVPILSDATVTINMNLYAAGKLSCAKFNSTTFKFENTPTSTQFNMDNITAHEVGHVAGLAHQGGTNCLMYAASIAGAATQQVPCGTETSNMQTLH